MSDNIKADIYAMTVEKLRMILNNLEDENGNSINREPGIGTETSTRTQEILKTMLTRGIINWGSPVSHILEEGMQLAQYAKRPESLSPVSLLLEGSPNSGKTALAAQLAMNSDFSLINICIPEDILGLDESSKCLQIRKLFEDAYKYTFSCILLDNIERLIDYCPIGPKFSNLMLQTLLIFLKKQPPKGRKLLILCTTSKKQVLEQMEIIPAFTAVLHVPNLSKPENLLAVLEGSGIFTKNHVAWTWIARKIEGRKISIGIKKLLTLIGLVRQTDGDYSVAKLLSKLEEDNAIGSSEDSLLVDLNGN